MGLLHGLIGVMARLDSKTRGYSLGELPGLPFVLSTITRVIHIANTPSTRREHMRNANRLFFIWSLYCHLPVIVLALWPLCELCWLTINVSNPHNIGNDTHRFRITCIGNRRSSTPWPALAFRDQWRHTSHRYHVHGSGRRGSIHP